VEGTVPFAKFAYGLRYCGKVLVATDVLIQEFANICTQYLTKLCTNTSVSAKTEPQYLWPYANFANGAVHSRFAKSLLNEKYRGKILAATDVP